MTANETVADYIGQMDRAEADKTREKIKTAMLHYCYFLPRPEWIAVQKQIEPFLEEIRGRFQDDPVIQRAEELLARICQTA